MSSIIDRAVYNETNLPKSFDEIIEARRKRRKAVRDNSSGYGHKTKIGNVLAHSGHCVICGYDKCFAALEFHHVDPSEKDRNMTAYITPSEADKCVLLCNRCHREHHNGGIQY